jgi:hypothetical protein
VKDQKIWTVGNVHAEQDQRSETFSKSRLRFKIERSTVNCLLVIDNLMQNKFNFENFSYNLTQDKQIFYIKLKMVEYLQIFIIKKE